jgi:hypothetical protein
MYRDTMDNEMQSCMHPVLAIKPHFTPLSILRGTQRGVKFTYIKHTIEMYSVKGLALACKHVFSCTVY